MSINITSLESALQSKLNAATGSTESKEFLLLTKALESLNSGAVSEVATTGDLPTASDNTGRVIWVTAETALYVSDGTSWSTVSGLDLTSGGTVGGNLTVTGNLNVQGTTTTIDSATAQTVDLGDNDKIQLGDSNDLQIYHDGANSYIDDQGTGILYLRGSDFVNIQRSDGSASSALFDTNGSVQLRHNNSTKIETTSSGVTVTGNINAENGHFYKATGNVQIGVQADSGIGSIEVGGTTGAFVDVKVPYTDDFDTRYANDYLNCTGNYDIRRSNSTKLSIISTGIDVTGEILADSYNETYNAVTSSSNATTVDCHNGNSFAHTLTENTTFTFSNPPASGTSFTFHLKIIQDASASGFTVTWPSSVDWPSATAPTLTATASAVDYFVFTTHDGGTTWYGFTAGQALG